MLVEQRGREVEVGIENRMVGNEFSWSFVEVGDLSALPKMGTRDVHGGTDTKMNCHVSAFQSSRTAFEGFRV